MKKVISHACAVILSLVVLVMLPSPAPAAVDLSGKLQIMYSVTEDIDNFDFNRLALRFNGSISETNGFKSEVHFRKIRADEEYPENPFADIYLEHAYYYQKYLSGNGELHIGYVPIRWHAGATATVYGSLGEVLMPQSSVGVKYTYSGDNFGIIGAIANAANRSKNNGGKSGYDLGVRGTFNPLAGLTVGAGLCNDLDVDDENSDTESLKMVVDVFYLREKLGVYGEFISVEKTVNGNSQDAEDGFHLETSYQLTDKFTAYAGMTSGADLVGNDLVLVGGIYNMAAGTTLHGEYADIEDGDRMFNLFLNVLF